MMLKAFSLISIKFETKKKKTNADSKFIFSCLLDLLSAASKLIELDGIGSVVCFFLELRLPIEHFRDHSQKILKKE